jgi:membrane protein YdbS with pleckstrin-like domain
VAVECEQLLIETTCSPPHTAMLRLNPGADVSYAEKNLVPGEAIVLRARYHWMIYRAALTLLVLAVLLGAASLYARQTSPGSGVARPVGFLALGFLAFGGIGLLLRWIRAEADEFVVTNRRVIRRVGLLAREIEQAPLEKIQDITVDQGGIARLLDYGTVTIETASERGSMTFPRIAHPESFRNALWGQAPAAARPAVTPPPSEAAARPATRERLAQLESLKQQGLVSDEEYASKRREILSGL